MKRLLLLLLIKLAIFSYAHTTKSLDLFVKILNKQDPLNKRKTKAKGKNKNTYIFLDLLT